MTAIPTPRCTIAGTVQAALLATALALPHAAFSADATTTIYLVRHAEKAQGGKDPELSAAGQARAQTLVHVLADAGIDAIQVSPYRRTAQTAAPLARALGIIPTRYVADDVQALAARVLADNTGQQVLVVGHSNTLDDLAAAFGIAGLADLDESQYDRLYVIHHRLDGAVLARLRYGDGTP